MLSVFSSLIKLKSLFQNWRFLFKAEQFATDSTLSITYRRWGSISFLLGWLSHVAFLRCGRVCWMTEKYSHLSWHFEASRLSLSSPCKNILSPSKSSGEFIGSSPFTGPCQCDMLWNHLEFSVPNLWLSHFLPWLLPLAPAWLLRVVAQITLFPEF